MTSLLSRAMTWARRHWAASALAAGLMALAALEGGLRAAGAGREPNGVLSPKHPVSRLLAPRTCRTLGSPETADLFEACTNGRGLRDREHGAEESPRVLILGDANAFGFGVEESDTFAVNLERALRLAMPGRRPGVFNAGLENTTSQVHQDALLRLLYDELRPNVVVLAVSEDADIDENILQNPVLGVFPGIGGLAPEATQAQRELLESAVPENFLARHSVLARLYDRRALPAAEIRLVGERLQQHGLSRAAAGRSTPDDAKRRFVQAFGDRYDADWEVTERALDRIRSFLEGRGTRLVLLRIPSSPSVDDSAWAALRARFCGADAASSERQCGALARDHIAGRLAAYAARHGVRYVDPQRDLGAALARGQSVHQVDSGRLSRLGHAVVGDALAPAVLAELGAKPQQAPRIKRAAGREPKVGAYFYPWYRTRDWAGFTDYAPEGGTYLSNDKAAIFRQLRDAERAELDFFVIELVGDHNADSRFNNAAIDALLGALLEQRKRGNSRLRFAMLSDISVQETNITSAERWQEATRRQLDQIWMRYVEPHRDAYQHVDGKPLVAIFSPPFAFDDPRFTVIRPYWVSHDQWKEWARKNEVLPFWDTYPQTVTDRRFVSVVPGYNDWRLERRPQVAPYLPRLGGRTFVEQWRRVFEVDPDVVLVYSFNEYFEQTQIEPTRELGDRYLLLNQLLARRFKERRPFADSELARLADVLEPPAKAEQEKVTWLPIDDARITAHGLRRVADGRAELTDHAELELPLEGDASVVFGVTHAPTFEPCAWLAADFAEREPSHVQFFRTDLTQLSVLRDVSIPAKGKQRVKLQLRRVHDPKCRDAGTRPIVITGITRYPVASHERKAYRLWYRAVRLEGFNDIETDGAGQNFSWTRGRSKIRISDLTPSARYRVTLTFYDTAGYERVEVGLDPAKLQSLAMTAARTVTLPEVAAVSKAGTIEVSLQTPIWLPSQRFRSTDKRVLGIALRLITLDRVDEPPQ